MSNSQNNLTAADQLQIFLTNNPDLAEQTLEDIDTLFYHAKEAIRKASTQIGVSRHINGERHPLEAAVISTFTEEQQVQYKAAQLRMAESMHISRRYVQERIVKEQGKIGAVLHDHRVSMITNPENGTATGP